VSREMPAKSTFRRSLRISLMLAWYSEMAEAMAGMTTYFCAGSGLGAGCMVVVLEIELHKQQAGGEAEHAELRAQAVIHHRLDVGRAGDLLGSRPSRR
jgi:hypothetical protein